MIKYIIICAVCVYLIITIAMPHRTRIKGGSMAPTLQDGQVLPMQIYAFMRRRDRVINRGDIVIARIDGEYVVKRVIATAGEHIYITPYGAVAVNGKPLREQYILHQKSKMKGYNETVPEDCVWLMGDNREESLDSRAWGAVESWRILAKVVL